jgi:hypothetical protein
MDAVIREYEVGNRKDGVLLVAGLSEAGYNVKHVVADTSKAARIPEISYYCVWTDGTITRGDTALDLPEVKAVNYKMILWDNNIEIEPLKKL